MTIQVDSRERKCGHVTAHFDQVGIKWFVSKVVCGDFIDMDRPRFAIDRKQHMGELVGNICQGHKRFRAELLRAQDLGIRLIFLVEDGPDIQTLSDVRYWENPRRAVSPYALDGMELYKRLRTIEGKYSTRFLFCDKPQTGPRIIELLANHRGD